LCALLSCVQHGKANYRNTLIKDHSSYTYKHYGNSRTNDVEDLKKYDMMLTTYRTLTNECFRRMRCPLRKIEWWRVILDEAHVIKNANAKRSRAVTKFTARRRWAVTGTHPEWIVWFIFPDIGLSPVRSTLYKTLLARPVAATCWWGWEPTAGNIMLLIIFNSCTLKLCVSTLRYWQWNRQMHSAILGLQYPRSLVVTLIWILLRFYDFL